jgi:ribosomal protein S18 acetylase RimI-like enzyme
MAQPERDGWRLVPERMDAVATTTELVNRAAAEFGRPPQFTVPELEAILALPSNDPQRDGRRLEEPDGTPVGAVMVTCSDPWRTAHLHLTVPAHPRREEALRTLVEEGLSIARSRSELASDALVEAETLPEEDVLAGEVLRSAGFVVVRRTCEMARPIDEVSVDAATVHVPEGISLDPLDAGDDALLVRLAGLDREAFADHDGDYGMTDEDFVHLVVGHPSSRPDLSVVASDDGGPVGLALSFADSGDPEGRTGYIGTIAVLRRARGRGVARALLAESFRRFRVEGWSRARLHVQLGNRTGADRLYRAVGMTPGPVDLSYERPLR